MSIKIAATAAAFLTLGVITIGRTVPAYAAPDMKTIDPDGDGKLTLAEAQAAGTKKFQAKDADKDGKLDEKEAGMSFKPADPDKDGTLDAKEYAAAIDAAFKAADKDKDGSLDEKELDTKEGKNVLSWIQ